MLDPIRFEQCAVMFKENFVIVEFVIMGINAISILYENLKEDYNL